jgi:hypothetical protein
MSTALFSDIQVKPLLNDWSFSVQGDTRKFFKIVNRSRFNERHFVKRTNAFKDGYVQELFGVDWESGELGHWCSKPIDIVNQHCDVVYADPFNWLNGKYGGFLSQDKSFRVLGDMTPIGFLLYGTKDESTNGYYELALWPINGLYQDSTGDYISFGAAHLQPPQLLPSVTRKIHNYEQKFYKVAELFARPKSALSLFWNVRNTVKEKAFGLPNAGCRPFYEDVPMTRYTEDGREIKVKTVDLNTGLPVLHLFPPSLAPTSENYPLTVEDCIKLSNEDIKLIDKKVAEAKAPPECRVNCIKATADLRSELLFNRLKGCLAPGIKQARFVVVPSASRSGFDVHVILYGLDHGVIDIGSIAQAATGGATYRQSYVTSADFAVVHYDNVSAWVEAVLNKCKLCGASDRGVGNILESLRKSKDSKR